MNKIFLRIIQIIYLEQFLKIEKNFYGNNNIKKNLNKNYYITFINDITNKNKLLQNNDSNLDIQSFNDYIYKEYKSIEKLF